MSKSVKIAWIQAAYQGDFQATIQYYLDQCQSLFEQGAEVIFLPELFHTPYFPIVEDPEHFNYSIPLSSPELEGFRLLCQKFKACVHLPIFEKRAPGLYHNSSITIGVDGQNCGHYRKMHIPDDPGFYEKYYFAPGDLGYQVVETPKLKFGTLICWDQWFPEAARITSQLGAELLIYPTAIGWDREEPSSLYPDQLDSWLTMMRSHAISNGVFSLAVNRIGNEGHLDFWGHSQLTSPSGKVLNDLHQDPSSVLMEIDLEMIEQQRQAWPFFRDRRVDSYQPLTQIWGE